MFDLGIEEVFNTGLWALPGALGSITLWMCGTGLMRAHVGMGKVLSRGRVKLALVEIRRAF